MREWARVAALGGHCGGLPVGSMGGGQKMADHLCERLTAHSAHSALPARPQLTPPAPAPVMPCLVPLPSRSSCIPHFPSPSSTLLSPLLPRTSHLTIQPISLCTWHRGCGRCSSEQQSAFQSDPPFCRSTHAQPRREAALVAPACPDETYLVCPSTLCPVERYNLGWYTCTSFNNSIVLVLHWSNRPIGYPLAPTSALASTTIDDKPVPTSISDCLDAS